MALRSALCWIIVGRAALRRAAVPPTADRRPPTADRRPPTAGLARTAPQRCMAARRAARVPGRRVPACCVPQYCAAAHRTARPAAHRTHRPAAHRATSGDPRRAAHARG
ncbi:hypothetical protein ACIO93_26555 [Streptomyces sp. NPDC087903]|uniref:hypothetical protein n=1 Tax=Streptomyces sp. NPDC087903 TaxID=3365819 RepID=UPI0038116339